MKQAILSNIKIIIYFIVVGVFLLSFFVESGPLASVKNLFLKGYETIPGQQGVFGIRDLLAFTVVYISWYVFFSIFTYLLYYAKRVFLLKKAEREYSDTHGMLDIEEGKDENE